MELKRVVVTGLGAITPLGNTLPETWEGIINGKSGAGPITQFDASKFKTQFACEVKGFDPLTVMDRKEARKCDRYSLFAINAAKQAINDAAMDLDKEDKNRIGVIFASGIGGIKTFDEEVLGYAKIKDTIGPKFNPFFIPKMISENFFDRFYFRDISYRGRGSVDIDVIDVFRCHSRIFQCVAHHQLGS